jgi:hypothetical protein
MSTSVLQDGVLAVTGEAQASNRINLSLSEDGSRIQVTEGQKVLQRVALAEVKRIQIRGGLLNDTITVSSKIEIGATIYGGAGDDTIVTGSGTDLVYGGDGNDNITVAPGDMVVDGHGNNTINRSGTNAVLSPPTALDLPGNVTVKSLNLNLNLNGTGTGTGTGTKPTINPATGEQQVEMPTWNPSLPGDLGQFTSSNSPAINNVLLIDARTDKVIGNFTNGMTIDLSKYSGGISVRADGNGYTKSVRFGVDGNSSYQTENYAPFTIAGDGGYADYWSWKPSVGSHTVKVTGYAGPSATGTASSTKTFAINVINSAVSGGTTTPSTSTPTINSFSLIDPTTNKIIGEIRDGDTINVRTLANGKSINIMANANGATKSVRFGYDSNSNYRLEVGAPFTLSGDSGNDYWSTAPSLGKHTVKATAYANTSGTGTSTSKTLTFNVVNQTVPTTTQPPTTTNPNIPAQSPSNGNVAPNVSFINPVDHAEQAYPGHYVIRAAASDTDGKVSKVEFFANGTPIDSTTEAPHSVAWLNVAAGKYTLTARATDNDGAQKSTSITVTIKNPTVDQTFYVSTSGNNSNSGGSTSSAFRTINHAASLAGPGDTIVILPGTYRESVTLKTSGTETAPITFKAQQPGTVFIDGADVMSGWSRVGSSHIYSADWDKDFFTNGTRVHGSVPETGHAEQFIYNNKMLTHVHSWSALSAGEFYVDWNANKVHVWLPDNADARSKTVLGSTRQTLMATTTAAYITVDGLNFRHAANFPQQPVVRTTDGWVVKNSKFEMMNAVALGIYGTDVLIQNNVMTNNGHTGLTGQAVNGLLVDNTIHGNNTRGFRATWESGGGKMTRTEGLYVLNMNSYNNKGPGFWLDVHNKDFVISGGFFHDNIGVNSNQQGPGMLIEINGGPGRVQGASFYGNVASGLTVAESTDITVRGNYFGPGNRFELRNMANRPYTIQNIKIESNRFQNSTIANADPNFTTNSFRTMNVTADFNVFDNDSNVAWYHWKGVKCYSGTSIFDSLGVDKTATAGNVTIPKA